MFVFKYLLQGTVSLIDIFYENTLTRISLGDNKKTGLIGF